MRKSIQFLKPIQDLCFITDNQETGVIKLHNLNSTFNLAACCRVPGLSVSQIGWNQLFSSLCMQDPSLIFVDFNSRYTSWNCSNIDANGIKLHNSINASDLIPVNHIILTNIDFNRNSLCNIDLVLFSPAIYDLIKFNILEDSWGSDHFPITVSLLADKTPYIQKQRQSKQQN